MKKPLIVTVALIVIAFLLRTPDTDRDAMIAKYTNAQSKFAESDSGLRIHYRDQGNPDGVPLILIHGTAASLHTWEPLVDRLGGEYRIITYTQPGHGLTGPHPRDDYSAAGMMEAVDALAKELKLQTFVLGGNSMGGWVSWHYALQNPDRVDALLLLDAGGPPLREGEEAAPSNIGFRILNTPIGAFLMQHYTPRFLVRDSALQSVSVKTVMDEETVDRYWELLRYPGNRKAAATRGLIDPDEAVFSDLARLETPTLVIWGAEDQIIRASAAQSFDETMPNADVVIYEGIGHLPMEEAPDRTALDIDAFLERTVKRSD